VGFGPRAVLLYQVFEGLIAVALVYALVRCTFAVFAALFAALFPGTHTHQCGC